jgi:hypothetical protein
LERRHGVVGTLNLSKLEVATKTGILNKLRQSVGQTTSANIMDESNGAFWSKSNASVDHHLGTTFHLRVATLNAVKVEVRCGLAAGI